MLTINLYYTGTDGAARKFAEEMVSTGTVDMVRQAPGNLRYEYFFSMDDPETILLIDAWKNQESLDKHHKSAAMKIIAELRYKYKLHLRVEKYESKGRPI